jgi:hypothetical protein
MSLFEPCRPRRAASPTQAVSVQIRPARPADAMPISEVVPAREETRVLLRF